MKLTIVPSKLPNLISDFNFKPYLNYDYLAKRNIKLLYELVHNATLLFTIKLTNDDKLTISTPESLIGDDAIKMRDKLLTKMRKRGYVK